MYTIHCIGQGNLLKVIVIRFVRREGIKPNYFKKQSSLSSKNLPRVILVTGSPNLPGVLSGLVPCI